MTDREKTLTEFIIEEQRRFPQATGDFTALLNYVRLACKRISFLIGRGALGGVLGKTGSVNVQARNDTLTNGPTPGTSCSRACSSCAPATRSTGRRRCSC